MQGKDDKTRLSKKPSKKIQLVGCGGFYQDILQSGVLDDVEVLKVVGHADAMFKSSNSNDETISSEIPHVLRELSPEHAEEVVLKNLSEINDFIDGDMLFLTCEMGINPCMGYISALAATLRDQGVFIVVVTPSVRGLNHRDKNEKLWISKFEKNTDLFISLPFNKLTEVVPNSNVKKSYQLMVRIVGMVIKDITNFVQNKGFVEDIGFLKDPSLLDDKNLRKFMKECSQARVGFGVGHGEEAYKESVENAMGCPLLTFDLNEARMVIVTISGDVCLFEAEKIAQNVAFAANFETSILWDVFPEDKNDDAIKTLIIALK